MLRIYCDVDVFANNVVWLANDFVQPLSEPCPTPSCSLLKPESWFPSPEMLSSNVKGFGISIIVSFGTSQGVRQYE